MVEQGTFVARPPPPSSLPAPPYGPHHLKRSHRTAVGLAGLFSILLAAFMVIWPIAVLLIAASFGSEIVVLLALWPFIGLAGLVLLVLWGERVERRQLRSAIGFAWALDDAARRPGPGLWRLHVTRNAATVAAICDRVVAFPAPASWPSLTGPQRLAASVAAHEFLQARRRRRLLAGVGAIVLVLSAGSVLALEQVGASERAVAIPGLLFFAVFLLFLASMKRGQTNAFEFWGGWYRRHILRIA